MTGVQTCALPISRRGLAGLAVQVQVRDLLGRIVSTQQVLPAAYQTDAVLALPLALPAGLYVVSATDGSHTWTTRWTLEP